MITFGSIDEDTSDGRTTLVALTRAARKRHDALAIMLKAVDLEALRQQIGAVQAAVDSFLQTSERKEPDDD